MKKFKFKFDAVLKIRKVQENDALTILASSQRAYQAELEKKKQLQVQLGQALIRRETLGTQPVGIAAFRSEQEFINGTKQRIIQSDQAIFRASKLVEKNLRNYLFARRKTRVMEVLYEKSFSEYRRERAKEEQRNNDDMILMRLRLKEEST